MVRLVIWDAIMPINYDVTLIIGVVCDFIIAP